jgi:hypothetical protein
MFDAPTLNLTPISSVPYVQEYKDKDRTALRRQESSVVTTTDIIGQKILTFQRTKQSTPTAQERSQALTNLSAPDEVESCELANARDTRMALLVQKYEGKASREDVARLGILTQRMRRLVPRVTALDLDELTGIADALESVSADIDNLEEEFGLS